MALRWLLRGLVALGALAIAFVVTSSVAAERLEQHPERLAAWIARAGGLPPDAVRLGRIDLDPLRWRFAAETLVVRPPLDTATAVEVARIAGALPSPLAWALHRRVDLGDVVVEGVTVWSPVQRPPQPLEPPERRPVSLAARTLRATGGQYVAAPDDPLPGVVIEGIAGEVRALRWWPSRRRLEGEGTAECRRMVLGNLVLEELRVGRVTASGTSVELGETRFVYGETEGTASGTITGIDGRPATRIEVEVEGERVERAVETAIGGPSPIRGRMSATFTLRSGGELPRGGARFTGRTAVGGLEIWAGPDPSLRTRLLVWLAPWFEMDEGGWIQVGDVAGDATFGRGWARFRRVERREPGDSILEAWGDLRDGEADLVIRARPRRGNGPGIGVVVEGPVDAPRIRLATEEDLADRPDEPAR